MNRNRILPIALAGAAAAFGAVAAGAQGAGPTVEDLLKQDYAVVGTITSQIGPGVFLHKKDKLYLCFVAETPKSPTVATRYCKPVQ